MTPTFRSTTALVASCLLVLTGCGGGGGGCSSTSLGSLGSLVCGSSGSNQAPVAAVAGPAAVTVRTTVTLDGTTSRDPDGQALTYRWELTSRPESSGAALSDPTVAKPVVVPDVPGTYTVRLIVSDGKADSPSASFSFVAARQNAAPTARAGENLSAVNGVEVVLNGTGSVDPDGDLITYRWSIVSRPVGSTANLVGSDTPRPSLTPDVSGNYVLSLVTSDGSLSSEMSYVTVASGAANVPPTAVATGPARVVLIGTRVTLDASASIDPNGDLLRYAWRLISAPDTSRAVLGFENTARPEFVPDVPGDYIVGLTVSDGRATSPERNLTVRVARTSTPTASAGPNQSVLVGLPIDLDGSASGTTSATNTANASLLDYRWTIVSRPPAVASPPPTIVNDNTIRARFVPDAPGTYVFSLTVTDSQGNRSSDFVTVRVAARNAPPVADAGGNRSALVSETVLFDGSRSTDANREDTLTYNWQLISSPTTPQPSTAKLTPASNAAGTQATGRVVALTPDVPGTYVVSLVVFDGAANSDPSIATVTVRAANQAPVARIVGGTGTSTGSIRNAVIGQTTLFDGRTSTDDGPTSLLTYFWRLEVVPPNSNVRLLEPRSPVISFTPDVPGDYVLRLQVDDGLLRSAEETVIIRVPASTTGGTGSGA